MTSIIRTPIRYKSSGLNEGEEVVIHIVTNKQNFINLTFNDQDQVKNIPNLIISDSTALSNKVLKSKLKDIEKKLLLLDSIYTAYSYLFVAQGTDLALVSMSMENTTLGFDFVKKIAIDLEIDILEPCWRGTFTQSAVNAFFEDIFIQRK